MARPVAAVPAALPEPAFQALSELIVEALARLVAVEAPTADPEHRGGAWRGVLIRGVVGHHAFFCILGQFSRKKNSARFSQRARVR